MSSTAIVYRLSTI